MPLQLNVRPGDPDQRIVTTIDGLLYNFDFRWNMRANVDPLTGLERGAWSLDVLDEDENPIASGLAVALGTHIGRAVDHPLFTRGVLVAVDTEGTQLDAGLYDLGRRVVLRYYNAFDMVNVREYSRRRLLVG